MPDVDHLIIGGGVAGLSCAQELRRLDPEATVLLVTRELELPYDRTAVSKCCLTGDVDSDRLLLRPSTWYQEARIDVLTRTPVARVDAAAHHVELADGRTIAYGDLLLATGAIVRRLRVPGAGLRGVHHLRAPGNAVSLRKDLEALGAPADVLLAGGSYIGCEVAAALTAAGHRCTVVLLETTTLETHLGTEVGRVVQDRLEARGIRFVAGDAIEELVGDGRVRGAQLRSGRTLDGDVCVVGIGAQPDVSLARASGLPVGPTGGVRCDAELRVDGVDDLFAAGDCCEWPSSRQDGPARVEHWETAIAQGRVAARGMAGRPEAFNDAPRFWCDLADGLVLRFAGVRPPDGGQVDLALLPDGLNACYADATGTTAVLSVDDEPAPDVRRLLDPIPA